MKIDKNYLKKIILEETKRTLKEDESNPAKRGRKVHGQETAASGSGEGVQVGGDAPSVESGMVVGWSPERLARERNALRDSDKLNKEVNAISSYVLGYLKLANQDPAIAAAGGKPLGPSKEEYIRMIAEACDSLIFKLSGLGVDDMEIREAVTAEYIKKNGRIL